MANKAQKRSSHEARKPKTDAGKTKGKGPRYLSGDTDIGAGGFLAKAASTRIARK